MNDIVSVTNFSNNSNVESKPVNCYPGVVNLSDKSLTEAEMSLLSKGLTFVDIPDPPDIGIIAEDLHKFHLSVKRHVALGKVFTTTTQDISHNTTVMRNPSILPFGHSKFRNPSKWNPPGPMIVEHMSMLNQEHVLDNFSPTKATIFNLTKEERSAKRSLSLNNDIIIKKADKGSAVVVQNRSDYIKEGLRQLSDRNFYRLQEENLTNAHNEIIKEQVFKMLIFTYYQKFTKILFPLQEDQ